MSTAKKRQILTVENALQGIDRNSPNPEEEMIVKQLDEDEQVVQKWLCLM